MRRTTRAARVGAGAFTETEFSHMARAVEAAYQKMLVLNPFTYDGYEMWKALVRPEHRAVLEQSAAVSGIKMTDTRFLYDTPLPEWVGGGSESHTIRINIWSDKPMIIPRYVGEGEGPFRYAAHEPAIEALATWATQRVELRHKAMLARDVIHFLSETNTSASRVFMAMPAIADLLPERRAEELRNAKVTGFMRVTPALRDAIQETVLFLATAKLLPAVEAAPDHVEVSVRLGGTSCVNRRGWHPDNEDGPGETYSTGLAWDD